MKLRGLRALLDGEKEEEEEEEEGVSGSRRRGGAKMTSQSIATNSSETGAMTLIADVFCDWNDWMHRVDLVKFATLH